MPPGLHRRSCVAYLAQLCGLSGRVLSGGLGSAMLQWPSLADALQMGPCSAVTAGLAGSDSLTGSGCTDSLCCCCRLEYLSKFMPTPSPHVHSFAAALVQRNGLPCPHLLCAARFPAEAAVGHRQTPARQGGLPARLSRPVLLQQQAHRLDASPVKSSLCIVQSLQAC